jgi:hypothetical protein
MGVLREIRARGTAEIGAHLHPWNTPPLDEALLPRNSMMKNLPAALQLAKLQRLTTQLRDALGEAPTTFRAGRYGLGPVSVSVLHSCGYELDSSVTPFLNWESTDEGPTFVGAPLDAYRLGVDDVNVPDQRGPLVEIPLTCGYTRFSSRQWWLLDRVLRTRPTRTSALAALASRSGFARLVVLSPESSSVPDMLALSRGALAGGARHLQMTLHSPSLRPGLSPWISTTADVDGLYASLESYLDGLSRMASVRCATLSEARVALGFGESLAARPRGDGDHDDTAGSAGWHNPGDAASNARKRSATSGSTGRT